MYRQLSKVTIALPIFISSSKQLSNGKTIPEITFNGIYQRKSKQECVTLSCKIQTKKLKNQTTSYERAIGGRTLAWNRVTLTGNRQNPSLTGNGTCNLKCITVRLKLLERIKTPWQVPPCLLFHWICIEPKRETGRKHFGFLLMKWLTNS